VVGQVADLLAGARIEDLPIPYTAVATDLVAGREVWFQRGQVVTAIRASIALPSFISPVVINGRLLADGGLLNPIPVAATAAVPDADLTLAVALSEGARSHGGLAPVHEDADGGPEEAYEVDEGVDQGDGLLWSVAQMLDSDLTQTITRWFTSGSDVEWVLRDPATGKENMDIDWTFERGDVVHMRMSNDRHTLHPMQHPIHIHGQRFLVLAQNGVPSQNRVWKDTFLLPVGWTADLLVEMSNPGRWMLHCHISEHLEVGMHMVFTVR
jgi:FtsP/CotA-like multicopper oxidase with cupredoxin domain